MAASHEPQPDAATVIASLELAPHPEGGWFAETFRDAGESGGIASTAIHYLLEAGQRSRWHRVTNAAEVWHHYAGGPLRLSLSPDGVSVEQRVLGIDLDAGQRPQVIVPRNWWQAAEPLGDWTLAGCTVAPGFEFDEFELAPPDWQPGSPAPRRFTRS